ncbi:sodium/sugar symporter [Aureibacter tunicatorum]|uniref:SSS family solute:Na+ symporter n=1 Tax=Aureibacter tunicatorum TaxID=866807 RepID=A0AAE3XTQ1_9BACT|nr:sodium/sugar symporter [Aureibacter tunicatorum]MDR6241696.1 SSS family solute:Na+ symporter [Aureibacter tunicatorum]BDD07319.1 transporter [Aureibacter tunicatorum]
MSFSYTDIAVFLGYCLLIVGVGLWMSREKKGHEKNAEDYFLASKSLPWWAIGASLIASNISAEQFIGMSGSGYAIGLGIAAYEWMAAITLILVAKFFLPIFLKEKIYTMPHFLEKRYDSRVRTSMAVFWILVYVFVNLTSVLYLGALALKTIMGVDLMYGIIGLALFSAAYTVYGGLKAVVWTDVIQVIFLIGGGLITTYLALDTVSDGNGFMAGLFKLYQEVPQKFDLILEKTHASYNDLPGVSVLVGAMWVANISYWGCNQYIIQRALAAKSVNEAQTGLVFAGFLKLVIPLIVVIPGIAAFALSADIAKPDEAYPWLLNTFVPVGIKGLAFAALIAAVVSSLSSMINSVSTIFTMDIYKNYFAKEKSEANLVMVGRIVSAVALIIAIPIAFQLSVLDQAFQYIQKYTGYISPGVVVIFIFGFFWKRATANAALSVALLSIPISLTIDKWLFPNMPFLDQMGIVFITLSAIMIGVSVLDKGHEKGIKINSDLFKTTPIFNISSIILMGFIAMIYALFW